MSKARICKDCGLSYFGNKMCLGCGSKNTEADEVSVAEIGLGAWNTMSEVAQRKITDKHRVFVKSDFFTEDGKPRCATCGKGMKPAIDSKTGKLSKYTWELDCECVEKYPKLKDLRLSIG